MASRVSRLVIASLQARMVCESFHEKGCKIMCILCGRRPKLAMLILKRGMIVTALEVVKIDDHRKFSLQTAQRSIALYAKINPQDAGELQARIQQHSDMQEDICCDRGKWASVQIWADCVEVEKR